MSRAEEDVCISRTTGSATTTLVACLVHLLALPGCGSNVAVEDPPPSLPPSCERLAAGCGDGETCCASAAVPGGTYDRLNDPTWPATVSSFQLDKYEVTVGRLREFVADYPNNMPRAGDGAHPRVDGSGWKDPWVALMPQTREDLVAQLAWCGGEPSFAPYITWTDTPGDHESMPATCMSWYEAFAFCAWDGGRLPTDAEWNYAAVGGAEQRPYPWGDAPPTPELVLFNFGEPEAFVDVGSRPAGAALWGHLDLNGSRTEITLDVISAKGLYEHPLPCDDCADLDPSQESSRISRDESCLSPGGTPSEQPGPPFYATQISVAVGVRCARDAE